MRIVSLCLSLRDLQSKSWQSKKSKMDGYFASLVNSANCHTRFARSQ
ncbi:hypothetical protein [Helicobacter sp. 23-1045]